MREAFELGWLNAYLHIKGHCFPEIMNIDDIQFFAPVDVGTTLSIKSRVTFI
jgi:acyl-coenzyme A thioesterase 9